MELQDSDITEQSAPHTLAAFGMQSANSELVGKQAPQFSGVWDKIRDRGPDLLSVR